MSRAVGVLGAVLAGGASRRFGRDKSAVEFDGVSMIERGWRSVSEVCAEAVVVSSRPDTPTGPWRTIPDRRNGAGPLAGIETALRHACERDLDAVLVLACDLPLVGADALAVLLDESEAGSRCVTAERAGEPGFEPLCAIYPVGALTEVEKLLDGGERAAWTLFDRLGGRRVSLPGSGVNVNTPADAERAKDLLADFPSRGSEGARE